MAARTRAVNHVSTQENKILVIFLSLYRQSLTVYTITAKKQEIMSSIHSSTSENVENMQLRSW